MRLENVLSFDGKAGGSGLFYACGDFGVVDAPTTYSHLQQAGTETYRYSNEKIALVATFEHQQNGAVIRRDYLENLTDAPVVLYALCSRFRLDGNDYEVYTQYNAWEHESRGSWQKLVTQISATSQGIRTCDGAAPMMALHNLHSGQNTVFHLLPNAQWKMVARKFPESQKERIVVEAGFNNENMHLTVFPGEKIYLPKIIFFSAKSKIDLDAYKLHEVYNALYPRKKMPVVYNSWLYCFDNLDVDDLLKQVDCAAELGIEAFMIDAGWFGNGEGWFKSVGDWSENLLSGPKGRLMEISRRVRSHGMVFGLWFEPERAGVNCVAAKEHPDYYIGGTLLDFSKPDAVDYMLDVISAQIEKYQIGWLKLDFNGTTPLDPSGNAFYRYMQGQRRFVETLKKTYPDLYITNCASGGYRMELEQGTMSDSFWLSDNQGPYEGIRIVKDTLKRMPTGLIERWNVQKYSEGFPSYGHKEPVGVMFSCNNATWDFILNVDDSFTQGFINNGPIGFSCDLVSMPASYQEMWKTHIARFKENREFYKTATARILVDREDITAIQYADPALERCEIQVFTKTIYAENLIVYPVLDSLKKYSFDGNVVDGTELCENGILFERLEDNHCYTAQLRKAD